MPVPQPPSIDTRIIDEPPVLHVRSSDIFFVVGAYTTDPVTVGLDGPYTTIAGATAVVGTDSAVGKAIADILSGNLDATVYASGVPGVSGNAIGTSANILSALGVVRGIPQGRRPTVLYAPGQTAGTAGVTTTASAVVNDSTNGLHALATELKCNAVADAAYDTVAKAKTWAGNNVSDNVMGVFNRIGGSADRRAAVP